MKPTRYHDLKMCVDRIRRQKLTSILTSISTLAFENRGAVSRFFGIEAAATGELTASNVRYKTDFSEDGVPTEESAKASADALLAFLKRGNEERKK